MTVPAAWGYGYRILKWGVGILNGIFGQSEKYQKGRGMSIKPVSGLNTEGERLRVGPCGYRKFKRYFEAI